MAVDQLLREIESPDFKSVVNLAASLDAFLRYAREQEGFIALSSECRREARSRTAVMARLGELAAQDVGPGVIPDSDACVAAYALALAGVSEDAAEVASTLAMGARGWWGPRMGRLLLDATSPVRSSAGSTSQEQGPGADQIFIPKNQAGTDIVGSGLGFDWAALVGGIVSIRQPWQGEIEQDSSSATSSVDTSLKRIAA